MLLEEAMSAVGEFGLFQYLLIGYLVVIVAPLRVLPLFAHIFSLLVPPHRCRLPHQMNLGAWNMSTDLLLNLSIPREADGSFSQCRMYDTSNITMMESARNHSLTTTTPCLYGWEYDYSIFYPTVVSEMDWVCEHSWKAYVANSVFWVATAVGVIISGDLSDRFGRVPVMIGVNVICGAACLYAHFARSFINFIASRVLLGLVVLAISITPFVLVIEYMAPEKRMLVLSAFQFSYPLVGAAFPWVAYALADWRNLTLFAAILPLSAPLFSWFVPESLRWLISRGKEQRAKKILKFIARVNRRELPDEFMQKCQFPPPTDFNTTKASVIDLLKTPNMRKNFILSLVVWTIACLVYTAGQLYAANATRNPFVMTSAINVVDIVATATALPLADRWGRRPTMMSTYFIAGLAYVSAVAIPKSGGVVAETVVFMVARLALTMAYNVGYLYAAEIYPTAARSQALSLRQAFGSAGKFLSSQVTQLAMYGSSIPLVLMGGMSCALAALTFPMPETLQQRLPESLEDGEQFTKGQYTCCFAGLPEPDASVPEKRRTSSVVSAASVVSATPD